jgi:SAM-dependent methyltransferase
MTTFTAPTLGDSPHNSKSVYEMLEDVDHGDDLWGEPALRAMDIAGVKAGWHCADIGAGSGAITELLARRVTKSGRIYAVDQDPTSRDAIADIALGHTQVIALTQAVEDLTLPEAVDLVWCRFLLLHVWDPEVAIAAMVASLKPGGWLVVEEPIVSAGRIDGVALSMPEARHPDIGADIAGMIRRAGCHIEQAWAFAPVGSGPGPVADTLEALTGVILGDESVVLSPLVTVVARIAR